MTKILIKPERAADTIKSIRLHLGLTQKEFAKALGYCSAATISHVESGKRTVSLSILADAARLAGYDMKISLTKNGDIPTGMR